MLNKSPIEIAGQELSDDFLTDRLSGAIQKYLSKSKCQDKEFVEQVMVHQSLLLKDSFILQMAVFTAKITLKKYGLEKDLPTLNNIFLKEFSNRLDHYQDSPPLDDLVGTVWLDIVEHLKLRSKEIGDSDTYEALSGLHNEMISRFVKIHRLLSLDDQVKRILNRMTKRNHNAQ